MSVLAPPQRQPKHEAGPWCSHRGPTRCGLADLSLTPLLPAPWPLQLWKDRGVIIGGSQSTKAAAQRQLQWVSTRLGSRQWSPHTMAPLPYHTRRAVPTLNLLSSPFTKTVITLGSSCWLFENPTVNRVRGATLRRNVALAHVHAHQRAKNKSGGGGSKQLILI